MLGDLVEVATAIQVTLIRALGPSKSEVRQLPRFTSPVFYVQGLEVS